MSLILVNDRTMSELHRRFMNLPGPTDVLTFPIELDSRRRTIGGEVYVCVPEARRHARKHGTTVADELLLYALHGMLHLSGFDDRTPAEYQHMHRTEDRILTRLGVGAVFNPPPGNRRDRRRARRPHGAGRSAVAPPLRAAARPAGQRRSATGETHG